ncbi:hypothetical protein EV359DRAFT_87735 [Lentinula novae-zelandiae]|nr:hypothetical protein EV359DRAFT_87735 [Lentinula novae-zelandiae]
MSKLPPTSNYVLLLRYYLRCLKTPTATPHFPGPPSWANTLLGLLQFVLFNTPTSPSSRLSLSPPVIVLGTSLDLLRTPSRVASHTYDYY